MDCLVYITAFSSTRTFFVCMKFSNVILHSTLIMNRILGLGRDRDGVLRGVSHLVELGRGVRRLSRRSV